VRFTPSWAATALGKSTLVSTLSGFTPADTGSIRIADTERGGKRSELRREHPKGDRTRPADPSALQPAHGGGEPLHREPRRPAEVRDGQPLQDGGALADDLLSSWNIDIRPDSLVAELSAGTRQLLEIMKALSRGVPVMILDEPTAALSNAEKRVLFEQVRSLKEQGVSFVYISHHLDEIFDIADTVTILRDGLVVKAREPVGNLDVEMIADLMMGEKTVRSTREDYTDRTALPCWRRKAYGSTARRRRISTSGSALARS
jgi:ABC-type sugar transport system ATPase subunit